MDPLDTDRTLSLGSAAEQSALPEGHQVGQYVVRQLLGKGGMGAVYVVEHEHLHTRHALKIVLPSVADRRSFRSHFLREAQITSRLNHPNVVRVTDFGSDGDTPYLVMDYIEGPQGAAMNLRQFMDSRFSRLKRFDQEEVVSVAEQVCAAVGAAHRYRDKDFPAGIIHRDLKPGNILVGRDTTIYITDFGLAHIVRQDSAAKSVGRNVSVGDMSTQAPKSMTFAQAGTYDYMSPEQRDGREVDARADVYSIGALLYELLTGRRVAGVPAPPTSLRPGIRDQWDGILLEKCLAYDPRQRFASVEELREAVVGLLRPVAAPQVRAPVESDDSASDEPQSWRPLLLAAVALVCIAAVVIAVYPRGAGQGDPKAATEVVHLDATQLANLRGMASGGDVNACVVLGKYYLGQSDWAESLVWYELASAAGSKQGKDMSVIVRNKLSPAQREDADRRVNEIRKSKPKG